MQASTPAHENFSFQRVGSRNHEVSAKVGKNSFNATKRLLKKLFCFDCLHNLIAFRSRVVDMRQCRARLTLKPTETLLQYCLHFVNLFSAACPAVETLFSSAAFFGGWTHVQTLWHPTRWKCRKLAITSGATALGVRRLTGNSWHWSHSSRSCLPLFRSTFYVTRRLKKRIKCALSLIQSTREFIFARELSRMENLSRWVLAKNRIIYCRRFRAEKILVHTITFLYKHVRNENWSW